MNISRYSIYKYIAEDRAKGGYLYKLLRNHGKQRKPIGFGSKTKIPNRVGIELRPQIADECVEYGHFEGNSIVSKKHNAITITLTEKNTMQQFIVPIAEINAEVVANAIISVLKNQHMPIKTLTVDNGVEFAKHALVAQELNCSMYFAKPYCSNDKALNENHNRLIRDFVPKGTDFRLIDENYWAEIQDI